MKLKNSVYAALAALVGFCLFAVPSDSGSLSVRPSADSLTLVSNQTFNDDVLLQFGSGGTVHCLYETADANANALLCAAPEGGGTDVPVFIWGDVSAENVDLGLFNGITAPTLAVLSDDQVSYVYLGHDQSDAVLRTNEGSFDANALIQFSTGQAITATDYQIGRDADATNQLHLNVPTGAGFERSINDAAVETLSASGLVETLAAGGKVYFDGTSTANTGTAGVLDIDVTTLTNNNSAADISSINTATTGNTAYGIKNSLSSTAVVTGTNQTLYGLYSTATKSGADTNANTTAIYGSYSTASNTGATNTGTKNTYGGYFSATGDANGTANAYALYADASGADTNYGLYVNSGWSHFGGMVHINDAISLNMGNSSDFSLNWIANGAGDDMIRIASLKVGAGDSTAWLVVRDFNPSAMTNHDDYLSPTFVVVNDEGADAQDYSAVVMGERAQSNVAVAHYFDFYSMTGAGDAGVDATTTELGATFRFGDNPAAGTSATGSGDVVFNDDIEVDGTSYFDGAVNINTGLLTLSTTAAITASTTQTQGNGALTTTINEVSVCANANDTVTLPAAAAGVIVYIFNNGAQTLQVFPASGDNIDGTGVNTAVTMTAGSNHSFIAHDATNWNRLNSAL